MAKNRKSAAARAAGATAPATPPATATQAQAHARGQAAAQARCNGCGEAAAPDAVMRRGRCLRCYEAWVRSKPVGHGAACAACNERRRACLRHFELHRLWVVLCHNCAARAEALLPMPRSVEGLRLKLLRERRWGDRRADSVSPTGPRPRAGTERRADDRRTSDRSAFDATELVVEIEADYAAIAEEAVPCDEPITGIHARVDPASL